jgi:L-fuculose-phosphate aldolase
MRFRDGSAIVNVDNGSAPSLDVILEELAVAHRVLATEGHGFGTIGTAALRDPLGRGFWTKRTGIGMEEVFGPAEMVLIDFDGTRVAGSGGVPLHWRLRSAIFRARPDVNAIVYAPSFYASVFSATGRALLPVTDEGKHFDFNVPIFGQWTGWLLDPDLCDQMVATLGDARGMLLKNNSSVAVAGSVPVAALRAIFLEKACEMQLAAEGSGYEWSWIHKDDAGMPGMTLDDPRQVENFWSYYLRRLGRLESGRPLPGDRIA